MRDHGDELESGPSVGHDPIEGDPPEHEVIDHDGAVRREAAEMLSIARGGGSVLTNRVVWTDANIEILVERFVKQPDMSGDSFFAKLDKQLEGVHDGVRFLFAEIFFLQMLPIIQFRKETKIRNIHRVLLDAETEYEIPEGVLEAFDWPVFNGPSQCATSRRTSQSR